MEAYLTKIGISPKMYLEIVRRIGESYGLDPDKLYFPEVPSKSKLAYQKPDGGIVYFGRIPYGDFIIWTIREILGKVPEGYALEKRDGYLKRARGIERHRETRPEFSPNQMAIKVLWLG
jgi:hypothetical protein